MIIHLISSPRTVSTSLMYAFDNRLDTVGMDEPFYAYYLKTTGKDHPGRQDVLEEMSSSPTEIVADINEKSQSSDHVFIKNMAHHLIDVPYDLIEGFTHVFLIRNPRLVIASLSKVFSPLELIDIAVKDQCHWYHELVDQGQKTIVVDSSDILKDPEKTLQKLCREIQLPFSERMLHWTAGSRSIDGSWAKYYYHNTHASTGFGKFQIKSVELSSESKELYRLALPYYEELKKHAI